MDDASPDPIRIIDAAEAHYAYILDSFMNEYREQRPCVHVPPAVLLSKMRALLTSPSWRALVATPDGDEILGYLVYRDETTIGWLQVKRIYRGRGVAKALCARAGLSPHVLDVAFLPDRKRAGWPMLQFRPYLPDVAALETALLEEMTGGHAAWCGSDSGKVPVDTRPFPQKGTRLRDEPARWFCRDNCEEMTG